jgi:hypothetical protein
LKTPFAPSWELSHNWKSYITEIQQLNKLKCKSEFNMHPNCSGDSCKCTWDHKHSYTAIALDKKLGWKQSVNAPHGEAIEVDTSFLYKWCSRCSFGGQFNFSNGKVGDKEAGVFVKAAKKLHLALVFQQSNQNITTWFKIYNRVNKDFKVASTFTHDQAHNTLLSETACKLQISDNVELKTKFDNFSKADFILQTKINSSLKVNWFTGLNLTDFAGKGAPYHGFELKFKL